MIGGFQVQRFGSRGFSRIAIVFDKGRSVKRYPLHHLPSEQRTIRIRLHPSHSPSAHNWSSMRASMSQLWPFVHFTS